MWIFFHRMGHLSYSHSAGSNSSDDFLDNISCDGSEDSLLDCQVTTSCKDKYYISVACIGEAECCGKSSELFETI